MQKYPCIIELFTYILNMFIFMFLCPINFSMSKTPQRKIILLFNTYKAIQCVQVSAYSSKFITYAPSFIVLGKLSLE